MRGKITAGMTETPTITHLHRNSLRNLRPPWRPGESGNPHGRAPGSRNRRTLRAEQIGKRVLKDFPDLIDKFERPPITDHQIYYQRRLQELMRDRRTNTDAAEIAKLEIVALALERLPIERRQPHLCQHCGLRLWQWAYNSNNETVPLHDETGRVLWMHERCALPALVQRRDQARRVADQLLPQT
jgi:hypothetical protein